MSFESELERLKAFSASLRRLPRVVAHKVAAAAAPAITELGQRTFAASQTSYGVPWAPGAEGQKITLHKSGALAKQIKYVAIGTIIRVALGVRYAKYQIGKRPVFPTGTLPDAYQQTLARIAVDVVRAELGGGR